MKKTLLIIATLTLLSFQAFCESDSDDYTETQTMQDIVKEDNNTKKSFSEKLKTSFSINNKYMTGDNFTLFTPTTTGGIKQQDAMALYHKKDDLYGFGSPYAAAYYMFFVDEKNLKLIENSYEKYLSDFSNKKLDRQSKKTNRAYGKIRATLNWGTVKSSTPNHGIGDVYLGYKFIKNSPYFTIDLVSPFENIYYAETTSTTEQSLNVSYYFTKAQMEALLNAVNPKRFLEIYGTVQEEMIIVDSDEY